MIAETNIPTPASSFLGREAELYEADLLLRERRVLTVHAPGGQGKTRFALELARRAHDGRTADYDDGVFACFLAPLRDPTLVLPTIAHALSLAEQPGESALETLLRHLADRRILLLLDNAEHVLACVPELARLMEACPGLTLVVTSRELLRLSGEVAYELPPLADEEGVALLCERAGVEPSGSIHELCVRVEGLPLAIELAAARLRILTPEQLLERLSRRLDVLKGSRDADPRQATLRATIQWSYDLLTPAEQTLFAGLSVFAGGCTPEAAEEVCAADLAILHSLVDKSLLRVTEERFWMLETIREFAGEELSRSGSQHQVQTRWATWCLALVEEAEPALRTGSQALWLDRLETEHDNLRAALRWALDCGAAQTAVAMAGAMWMFWYMRGHVTEGRMWLEQALAAGGTGVDRARALDGAGYLAGEQADYEVEKARFEEAVAILRAEGNSRDTAFALSHLAMSVMDEGDLCAATGLAEESVVLARESGDAYTLATALNNLAEPLRARKHYMRARGHNEEALALRRGLGDGSRIALSLNNLGELALMDGDHERAIAFFSEASTLAREVGDKRQTAVSLCGLGWASLYVSEPDAAQMLLCKSLVLAHELGQKLLAADCLKGLAAAAEGRGELEDAARLLGSWESVREGVGPSPGLFGDALDDRTGITAMRMRFEEEPLCTIRAQGRAMTLDDAVGYALEGLDTSSVLP